MLWLHCYCQQEPCFDSGWGGVVLAVTLAVLTPPEFSARPFIASIPSFSLRMRASQERAPSLREQNHIRDVATRAASIAMGENSGITSELVILIVWILWV